MFETSESFNSENINSELEVHADSRREQKLYILNRTQATQTTFNVRQVFFSRSELIMIVHSLHLSGSTEILN